MIWPVRGSWPRFPCMKLSYVWPRGGRCASGGRLWRGGGFVVARPGARGRFGARSRLGIAGALREVSLAISAPAVGQAGGVESSLRCWKMIARSRDRGPVGVYVPPNGRTKPQPDSTPATRRRIAVTRTEQGATRIFIITASDPG